MKKAWLFLALALTAVAADNPPRMLRLYQTEVPAESAADLYAAQRDIAGIYQANKAPIPRSAWTSMTGPPMLYYVVPFSGIALMGETTWLQQQGDESSRQARASRLNKVGGATASKISSVEEDLTWTTAPQYAPSAYATAAVYSVKPGKVTDFLAALKEGAIPTKRSARPRVSPSPGSSLAAMDMNFTYSPSMTPSSTLRRAEASAPPWGKRATRPTPRKSGTTSAPCNATSFASGLSLATLPPSNLFHGPAPFIRSVILPA